MPNKSPLRYPGGKTRALPILERYLETYYPGRTRLLSPFLGGGSFELSQAAAGKQVFANDLFRPLYTFWQVLKLDPRGLHAAVNQHLPVSNETFLTFRNCNLEYPDVQQVAAAYFIVNRCSFSGATFCGGFSAEASEKRCNQSAVDRLLDVDMKNITLSNQDAIEFLRSHPERPDTVVYADPPYYITSYVYGKNGDMHEGFDHVGFADYLKTRSDWILSYNDCPYIRDLYAGCRIVTESWKYGMNNGGKPSSEVIILPPGKTDDDASCEQSVDV